MKKIILLFSALATSLSGFSQKPKAPDFAFPQKVEKTAQADLRQAIKGGNGPAAVNAVIRWSLAKAQVSSDSLPEVIDGIEKTSREISDPVTGAMLNTLTAVVYTQICERDSYKIDQRENMGGTGSDFSLWSRDQFYNRVDFLVSAALGQKAALQAVPMSDYKDVIEYENGDLKLYPTLYDFIAVRAIDCLDNFIPSGSNVLNPALLNETDNFSLYPGGNSPLGRILCIYEIMSREFMAAENYRAAVNIDMQRLAFINRYVFRSDYVDEEPVYNSFYRGGSSKADTTLNSYQKALLERYSKMADLTPDAVRYLLATDSRTPAVYNLLKEFKEKHPDYSDINAVTNMINSIAQPTVSLDYGSTVVAGGKLKVKISSSNARKLVVSLYDVTKLVPKHENGVQYGKIASRLGTPTDTRTLEFNSEIPFSRKDSVEFTVPKYGLYIVTATLDGNPVPSGYWMQTVACTDLMGTGVATRSDREAVVVNPVTGEPQKGVTLYYRPWSRREGFRRFGRTTDSKGIVMLNDSVRDGEFVVRRGDDNYAPSTGVVRLWNPSDEAGLSVSLNTPLKLYHPGDTVEFSAVAFESPKGARRYSIAAGRELTVTLLDANYQEAGEQKVTTDEWGRASGSFVLPSEGLQGTFTLRTQSGSCNFTVSDYRLPTFRLENISVERPSRLGEPAVVNGTATTFAGFPVADAQVKIQLRNRTGFWWWSTTSGVFATVEGTTKADGTFSVEIPADVITGAPSPTAVFLTEIAVTSKEGETQTGDGSFNLGKPFTISASIPSEINLGKPVKATVELLDFKGEKQNAEITYRLKGSNSNGPVAEKTGTLTDADLSGVISALAPGVYTISFSAADAQPSREQSFTLWSATGRIAPSAETLWLPSGSVTAAKDGVAELHYGSGADGAWVLLTVADDNCKMIENRWLRTRKGMNTEKIRLPEGFTKGSVALCGVSDYMPFTESRQLEALSATAAIDLRIETFRDKVTPGDKETVTFRVVPKEGAGTESALMLAMTNMAINQLAPSSLEVSIPQTGITWPRMSGWNYNGQSYYASVPYKSLKTAVYYQPDWNLYDLSFTGGRYYGLGMMRVRGTRPMALEEAAVEDEAVTTDAVENKAVMKSAAPSMKMADMDMEMVEEAAADAGGAAESPKDKNVYRPSEIPVAFFRPMLVTKPDGTLEISYTVPDANTTWILRGVAYDRDLLSASAEVNILASKPLMVNLNAPRFLRGGDVAVVKASVMNNTDSVVSAEGVVEVVTSDGKKVLSSRSFRFDSIAPKGQQIVDVDYTADAMIPAVILRVKAGDARFTDGEQQLVPVLPSDQDVMESKLFFVQPGQSRFEMNLPAIGEGDRAMLNFTENPTWQVVSALPGLRKTDIKSSVEAAHALFSARVAEGLMRRYPEIVRTLRRWAENPQDSALISNLQKNSQLRQVLLSATPWVQNAQNDTERMQRLLLLLDGRENDRVTANAIDLLRKTSVSGGGWCWTASYPEVSEWATTEVLITLGLLNKMSWLPDNSDLQKMISEACKWYDRETAKDFAKYPKSDYSLYTFIRGLYPSEKQSTAAVRVTNATVQRIIAGWKRHDIQGKAVDALILSRNGYSATARQILASLREYATSTPEKGMWWQQLDHKVFWSMDRVGITSVILQAFSEVEPKCADIDRIRQWLLLQKQNTDWGSSAVTTMAVASILTSGSEWTVNPKGTAIHIGDRLVEAPNPEYATGEFTVNISEYLTKAEPLVIDRQANYPSFGGVVTMSRRPMSSVKAVACAEASVEKSMSVFRDGTWVPGNEFKVGDRVKVTLTVRADDDLDYVVILDPRAAGLQLSEQLPTPVYSDGLCFYRENGDSATNLYIGRLPRGTYILSYDLFAAQNGTFTSGAASLQSQYNPLVVAHSAGSVLKITD